MLLRHGAETVFWSVVPAALVVGCGISMSFTAIQLALNDVAPSALVLGTLNALALTGSAASAPSRPPCSRACTPWAPGRSGWTGMPYGSSWTLLALGVTVAVHYLPDYDQLRKARREEEQQQQEQ